MAISKDTSSTKRFGARYGRTGRVKVGQIEKLQRKKYKCPYCSKEKVKRVSAGIWQCQKCFSKFTGKAYTITRQKPTAEESKKEILEEKKEAEEAEV